MLEITVTSLKFLAAALIKAVPPISIYSIKFFDSISIYFQMDKDQQLLNLYLENFFFLNLFYVQNFFFY